MTTLVPTQDEASAAQVAFGVEVRIKQAMHDGRDALWRLAEALYEFDEMRGWEALGHDNKEQWLADADVTLAKGTYHRLVRTWRKLVVERQIDAGRLRLLDQSKVAIVTDAIVKNDTTVDEALSDVEALAARDLREKYYGPRPTLDESPAPAQEPEFTEGEHSDADDDVDAIPDYVPPVDPDSEEPMSEEELASALADEEALAQGAVALTTAVVDGEVVRAEVLEPGYDYPPWVTPGAVQTMLNDLRFGLGSGASYPRLSRQGCQIAEQLAQAWLATHSN